MCIRNTLILLLDSATNINNDVADTHCVHVLHVGYIQPMKYVNAAGVSQYYVDGGVVCNFPLHCFDGM